MKFKYRNKISFGSLVVNLVVIAGFFYALFNANNYNFYAYTLPTVVQAYSINLQMLQEEYPDDTTINVNNIFIDDSDNSVITYIVQPGDNLSKIALNFGVTVSHIKKVNHLKGENIKPGQKLKITDEEGFLYTSKGESIKELAQKFKIKTEDLLEANGIDDVNYRFDKGDEVFIPMSDEQYNKLFHKPKPKPKPHSVVIKPVKKPSMKKTTHSHTTSRKASTVSRYRGKTIVAKYRYRPNISNGFYRGHCTRYVAIKKFPYIKKGKQKKLWNGNAKYWYANAKKAGYPVGHTPRVGAIVVIRVGGRRYYYAGHVAIVRQIDRKNKRILVEEMNAKGKYVVTKRWIPMNSKIIGYIYL